MSDSKPGKPKGTRSAAPTRKRASRAKPKPGAGSATPTPTEEVSREPSRPALFEIAFEVRWRDLDAFNHVNNSTFLTYLEEARLRWLESLDGPWLSETSAPVLAAAELQFRRPIPWPETLRVVLRAERVGHSSLTLAHRIESQREPDVLYCEGRTVMVWVDATTQRGAPLPEAVVRAAAASDAGSAA